MVNSNYKKVEDLCPSNPMRPDAPSEVFRKQEWEFGQLSVSSSFQLLKPHAKREEIWENPARLPVGLEQLIMERVKWVEYHLINLKQTIRKLLTEMTTIREHPSVGLETEMLLKKRREHLGIYGDIQNLYYVAQGLDGKIDHKRLKEWSVASQALAKANAFLVINHNVHSQEKFHRAPEDFWFPLRTKVVKFFMMATKGVTWIS